MFLRFFLGLCFGTLFGAIPGLTATMGIALVIPLTFTMPPITAFAALLGAYKGGVYGGSIPAILINTPGTPVAAVTTFDGYPLAKMGKAGKAMDVALWSSVIADILSTMCLMFFAVSLAKISLKFGPPEFAGIMIFALVLVAGVSWRFTSKGNIGREYRVSFRDYWARSNVCNTKVPLWLCHTNEWDRFNGASDWNVRHQ